MTVDGAGGGCAFQCVTILLLRQKKQPLHDRCSGCCEIRTDYDYASVVSPVER